MTKRFVLLDTQRLVLLSVGATRRGLVDKHKRTKGKYTGADFDLLPDLLGHDPRIGFCAPVAAETSNLISQHREPDRFNIMAVLKALLSNATELPITCRAAMQQPDFVTLGLADAAQLALCTDATVLLTADEPLFNDAKARGATVLYFANERRWSSQADD